MPIIKTYEASEASPRPNATVPYTFLLLIHILLIKVRSKILKKILERIVFKKWSTIVLTIYHSHKQVEI